MGKLDDMRRLREQQCADGQKRRTTPRAPEAAAPIAPVVREAVAVAVVSSDAGPAQPTRPARAAKPSKVTSSKSGRAVSEQGKCPTCGKMKPLSNGMLASHQKGFGKACAGSRQPPV
jgi:hypothetical protein